MHVNTGIPQGTVLKPLTFITYSNELLTKFPNETETMLYKKGLS